MSQLKNTTKKNWGITISPPPTAYDDEQVFTTLVDSILKKFPRHISVFERGSTGTHLHTHLYVESDTAQRRDVLKTSLLRMCHKVLTLNADYDNVLLYISAADNPTYYVSTYMTKEQVPIFVGIDPEKYNTKNVDRVINLAAAQKRNLTMRNADLVFKQALEDGFIPDLTNKKGIMTEMTKYLFKNNYDVQLLIKDASYCYSIWELVVGTDVYLKQRQENSLEKVCNGYLNLN